QDDVAIRAVLAGQQSCQRRCIMLGVAAAQIIHRRQRQAGVGGRDGKATHGAVLPFGHLGRAGGGQFVQTLTVDGPGAPGAEPASRAVSAAALGSAAPPRRSSIVASGRPASAGVTVKRRTAPSFHSATSVGPVVVSSSRPWPLTVQARLAPRRPRTSASGSSRAGS